jgi:hypothetical protein
MAFARLTTVPDVPGSNPSQGPAILTEVVSGFSQSVQGNTEKKGPRPLPRNLPVHHSQTSKIPTRRYIS